MCLCLTGEFSNELALYSGNGTDSDTNSYTDLYTDLYTYLGVNVSHKKCAPLREGERD